MEKFFTKIFNTLKNKLTRDILLVILAMAAALFTLVKLQIIGPNGAEKKPGIHTITLTFSCFWENREDALEKLINEYQELHRGIRINLNHLPYETFRSGLQNEMPETAAASAPAAGSITACDIIALDQRWVTELQERGIIEPETYPLLRFFYPLFYNTGILLNSGINHPPKTRGEFLDQAKKISGNGVYAAAMALGENNGQGLLRDVYPWIWAAGSGSLSAQPLKEALDFILILHNENLLLPGTLSLDERQKAKAFLDGRIAFMIGSAEDMESAKTALGDSFGYTTIPAPDNYQGKPYFGAGSWILGIPAQSKYREEALSFINYLMENNNCLAEGWAIPKNGNPGMGQDLFYSKAAELYIGAELVDGFAGIDMKKADAVFYDAVRNLLTGNMTSEEAAGHIMQKLK